MELVRHDPLNGPDSPGLGLIFELVSPLDRLRRFGASHSGAGLSLVSSILYGSILLLLRIGGHGYSSIGFHEHIGQHVSLNYPNMPDKKLQHFEINLEGIMAPRCEGPMLACRSLTNFTYAKC